MNLDPCIRESTFNIFRKKWRRDPDYFKKNIKNINRKELTISSENSKAKIVNLLSTLRSSRSSDKKNFIREIIYEIIIRDTIYKDFNKVVSLRGYASKNLQFKESDFETLISKREYKRIESSSRTSIKEDLLFAIELGSRVDINRFSFDEVFELLNHEDTVCKASYN
jgi:hypothetical protein